MLTLYLSSGEARSVDVEALTAFTELTRGRAPINGELPISPNSALGRAVYGEHWDRFTYEIEGGTVHGQILKIEVWQPVFGVSGFTLLRNK